MKFAIKTSKFSSFHIYYELWYLIHSKAVMDNKSKFGINDRVWKLPPLLLFFVIIHNLKIEYTLDSICNLKL